MRDSRETRTRPNRWPRRAVLLAAQADCTISATKSGLAALFSKKVTPTNAGASALPLDPRDYGRAGGPCSRGARREEVALSEHTCARCTRVQPGGN
ncbi:hypothetical protein MRX96_019221 [Rhipicephalus microplus]